MRIRARGVALTPELEEHVERRLAFALGRFDPRIESVTVTLGDAYGPRRGLDKRCLVQVRLLGTEVVAEDAASDLRAAIDRAGDRAGRAVAREVERRRTLIDRTSAAGPQ